MLKVAHRGVVQYAPENTLPAFQHAMALGADMIHIDVHVTSDHVPVVFRDQELRRLTDGRGSITQKTLSQLKTLRVLGREPIPTLQETVDCIGSTGEWYLELKGEAAVRPIFEVLWLNRLLDRAIVGSSNLRLIREVKVAAPGLRAAYFAPHLSLTTMLGAADAHADYIHLHVGAGSTADHFVSDEMALRLRAARLSVIAWEDEGPESLDELRYLGCDPMRDAAFGVPLKVRIELPDLRLGAAD
ncbi:MAG: glycerophosphodiester phosphodiesterase [Anaerolineae bacterium]